MIKKMAVCLAALFFATFAVSAPAHAAAVQEAAETAALKVDGNLRALPTTSSAILQGLPAGTPIEVLCWAYGEPTYGTDAYGAMWLYTTLGGWVHSFLVTPVDVEPCAAAANGFYDGRTGGGVYADCSQAIAAGAAPMFLGEPTYSPHLDRDHDGIACEWSEP